MRHSTEFFNELLKSSKAHKHIFLSIAVQLMTIAVHPSRPPADLFPLIHGQFAIIRVPQNSPPADAHPCPSVSSVDKQIFPSIAVQFLTIAVH